MDPDLTPSQRTAQKAGADLGRRLPHDAGSVAVVAAAADAGLLTGAADLALAAVSVEALAAEQSSAGMMLALHLGATLALQKGARYEALRAGRAVGALALSADEVPRVDGGRLRGRALWVAPLTHGGVALVGARNEQGELAAFAVDVAATGRGVEPLEGAGLSGIACAHLQFEDAAADPVGPSVPVMTLVRVLVAAVALGIGRRALREALTTARRARTAAAGEQTVQGLLADAATELEAATLLVWNAAADHGTSLGTASTAKLAASAAAQSAVLRATQVIGAESFRQGHVVERLSRDVRALELFAGRTEALRAAVAAEVLPQVAGRES